MIHAQAAAQLEAKEARARQGDFESLHHAVGKAMYGWSDDEPNSATGFIVRMEVAAVVLVVIDWLETRKVARASDVFVAIEPCGCVAGATTVRRPEAVKSFFEEMKGINTVAMPVEEFRARPPFCGEHPDGPPYWSANGGAA